MKARVVASAIVLTMMVPTAGLANDNPWKMIKEIFKEPATELKQQFKQLRPPANKAPAAKVEANEAPATAPPESVVEPEKADTPNPPVKPVPVANPQPETGAILAKPASDAAPKKDSPNALADPATADVPKAPATPVPVANPQPKPGTILEKSTDEVAPIVDALAKAASPTEPAAPSADFDTALAPIPRPRPAIGIPFAPAEASTSATKTAAAIGAVVGPLPSLVKPPPAAQSTCGAALARLGVEASAIAPISEGDCGIAQPVVVASLSGGAIDLTTKAIVACPVAESVANWLDDSVQPAAKKFLDGKVVGLRVAASYTCRTRNSIKGAKLSEHGRGNAIDISAINVAGRGWIDIGGGHPHDEARFLSVIRSEACGPFTTVLGPGSDIFHHDHFHFDLAKRNRGGPSRGLYCK